MGKKAMGALIAVIVMAGALLPVGPALADGARPADDRSGPNVTGAGTAAVDLILGHAAEETKLAHQRAASVARAAHCPDPATCTALAKELQKGYVFEIMSRDAHNARRPRNKLTLEVKSNATAVDGALANGRKVQMKASRYGSLQSVAIRKLDEAGYPDGEVLVPKGDKTLQNPRVKESPVSQDRIRRASTATARARTTAEMVRKGAKAGGASAAAIETGVQAYRLWSQQGEGLTLTDWAEAGKAIAAAGGCGAAAAAAGTYSASAASAAASPVGGAIVGVVVGGVVYFGCEWGVDKVLDRL